MNDNNQILVLRDNAERELLQIKTVEDGITYLNKLKAIDVWVKAEKKDAELQNIIAEQKLRTQRILGELIAEGQRKGTIANGYDNLRIGPEVPDENSGKKTTSDLGISRKKSSAFQQIASIPEDDFEEYITTAKDKVNSAVAELTTTGAVRLAKSLQQKKDDLDEHLERQDQLDSEKKLKKLASEINMTYTKDQRRFFVNLIKI